MLVLLFLAFLLVSCGGEQDEPSPTPTSALPPAPISSPGGTPETTAGAATGPIRDCAYFARDGSPSLTWDDLYAQYVAKLPTYTWPTGYVPDPEAIFATESEAEKEQYSFQCGYDDTMLGSANVCAWYMSWLDARAANDADGEALALSVMTTILPGLPSYLESPSMQEAFQTIHGRAQLGDASLVQNHVTVNCGYVSWQQWAMAGGGQPRAATRVLDRAYHPGAALAGADGRGGLSGRQECSR